MTRKIKAQDVKPGMKVEFTYKGWTSSGIVDSVWTEGTQTWFCSQSNNARYLSSNQEVTVLSEPQPDEPTAFGACVEVAGVKYVRDNAEDRGEWENVWFSEYRLDDRCAHTWEQICERGPVRVINPDPFTNTEPREPRVWKRWKDVPELTPVRTSVIALPYRKVGDRIECRRAGSWVPAFSDEYELNKFSPFTEVLPCA